MNIFSPLVLSAGFMFALISENRTLDTRGEPAIYLGRGIIDKMWCHVCYAFNKGAPSRETFVFTNNVVFGHTFPMNQPGLD